MYKYTYALSSGVVTEQFTASQVPKIGDSINAGVLVPLVGHLINQDHSKWLPVEYDEWPERL